MIPWKRNCFVCEKEVIISINENYGYIGINDSLANLWISFHMECFESYVGKEFIEEIRKEKNL